MPVITGTTLTNRAANRTMAASFFPLAQAWPFIDLMGSYPSYSLLDTLSIGGSVPQMSLFIGGTEIRSIPSYRISVPNNLYSAAIEIDQTEFEGDQTGTLVKYAPAMGVSAANTPWQVFASKIIKGATTIAISPTLQAYSEKYQGTTYYQTMDSLPVFSDSHNTWSGGNQGNIVTGNLPTTNAALNALAIAEQAKILQSDFSALLDAIQGVKDTAGVPRYAHIDPAQHLVLMFPPALRQAARLAFETPGNLINATTGVAAQMVKKVLSSGYLKSMADPSDLTNTLTPGTTAALTANATDWYAFITGDYVMPWYWQQFVQCPTDRDDIFAGKFDVQATIDAMLAKNASMPDGQRVSAEAITQWASTRVDTTFNKVGANADYWTIKTRKFYVACWSRLNIVPGPWFLSWKVKPSGGN